MDFASFQMRKKVRFLLSAFAFKNRRGNGIPRLPPVLSHFLIICDVVGGAWWTAKSVHRRSRNSFAISVSTFSDRSTFITTFPSGSIRKLLAGPYW